MEKVYGDRNSKFANDTYLKYYLFDTKHEIITVSSEIKYRLGVLLIYAPFVRRISDFVDHDLYSRRFHFELPVCYETLYKYWQRLANYLILFFPPAQLDKKGSKEKIYFDTPINYVVQQQNHLTTSPNFTWLHQFFNNEYKEMNKIRKAFVHDKGYVTSFFRKFRDSKTKGAIHNLNLERLEHLDILTNHISLATEGYFRIMDFINEIDIKDNPNNEELKYSLR